MVSRLLYIPCSIRSDALSVKVADNIEVNGLLEQIHLGQR